MAILRRTYALSTFRHPPSLTPPQLKASCVQIYNKNVTDLLSVDTSCKNLALRERGGEVGLMRMYVYVCMYVCVYNRVGGSGGSDFSTTGDRGGVPVLARGGMQSTQTGLSLSVCVFVLGRYGREVYLRRRVGV